MDYQFFSVESKSDVKFADIADSFADMSWDEQAVFLNELFSALSHKIKDRDRYFTRIILIAKQLDRQGFSEAIEAIDKMDFVLQPQKQQIPLAT